MKFEDGQKLIITGRHGITQGYIEAQDGKYLSKPLDRPTSDGYIYSSNHIQALLTTNKRKAISFIKQYHKAK